MDNSSIEIMIHFENNFESFLPRRGTSSTFGVRSHRRNEKISIIR